VQLDEANSDRAWRLFAAMSHAGDYRSPPGPSFGCKCRAVSGITLIELLCVMVIISILASLLLPTVARVYSRVRATAEEFDAPEIASLLLAETRGYCARTHRFRFDSKSDFAEKCGMAPKCRSWIHSSSTEFVPFSYLDPTNKIVLVFHFGRNHASRYDFNVGELSIRPPER
jgi:prepilin-type N-terminal cleavage/methylation domain-containing protein